MKFGITTPLRSHNVFKIVFHVWVDIFRDLKKSRSFKESMAILFRRPGKYDPVEFDKAKEVDVNSREYTKAKETPKKQTAKKARIA